MHAAREAWQGHDQALVNAVMYVDPMPFPWSFFDRRFIGSWNKPGEILTHFNGNKQALYEQLDPEIVEKLEQEHQQWRSRMSSPAWPSKPRRRKVPIDGVTYELNI